MSTTKDAQQAQHISQLARVFVGLMALGGAAVVTLVALGAHPWFHSPFLVISVIAVPASRLKLKLPGLNGNMSVSLPFILLAAATLSTLEALVLGILSAGVQSLPREQNKIKPIQIIFNLSTMVIAVFLASAILHGGVRALSIWASASGLLVLAGTSLVITQTLPVATIISLTEGGRLLRIWFNIFQLSFPYYVLSTGIASIMTTLSKHVGWQIPLLTLPVMYGVYNSYRLYFRSTEARAATG
jgi:hypothetical protein